jgi:hypothetical protein
MALQEIVASLGPTGNVGEEYEDEETYTNDEDTEVGDVGLGGLSVLNQQRARNRSALEEAFRLGEERLTSARGPSASERRLALAANLVKPTTVPGVAGVLGTIASAQLQNEQARRQSAEGLEDRRAEFALERSRALAGSDLEYDKLAARYGDAAARRDAVANKPRVFAPMTNNLKQIVQNTENPDGSVVQKNYSTGETTVVVQPRGGAVAGETTGAEPKAPVPTERKVYPLGPDGPAVKVGDVFQGPDKKFYRALEGNETEVVAGSPGGDKPMGFEFAPDGVTLKFIKGGPEDPEVKERMRTLTGEQQRFISLTHRTIAGNEALNQLAKEGIFKPVSPLEQLFDFNREGKVIGIIARKPEDRRFIAAAQAFLQPILRLDSGAAVPAEELYNYMQTMLPQYTDDIKALREKAKRREETIRGLYMPQAKDYDKVFGKPTWNVLVPRSSAPTTKPKAPQQAARPATNQPQSARPTAPATGPNRATFLAAARKANPGVNDAQLNAYYDKTYGAK